MRISFDGAGQWGATFRCQNVSEGQLVRISGNGTVAACVAGDGFAGPVLHVGRDGGACTVQLGGAAALAYSGAAPTPGWTGLAADGSGGVKVLAGGREYLVLDVDEAAGTVSVLL